MSYAEKEVNDMDAKSWDRLSEALLIFGVQLTVFLTLTVLTQWALPATIHNALAILAVLSCLSGLGIVFALWRLENRAKNKAESEKRIPTT
jgi:uncharacterized membrane protein YqjE